MSNELKNVYERAGALDRFFDQTTPVDLFRGKRHDDKSELLQPVVIGWVTRSGPRNPDILIVGTSGVSPQYQNGDFSQMCAEPRDKPSTADILLNADQYIVKGCRTMDGHHRGVSVFDKKNPILRQAAWYMIPAGSAIPVAMAVTRDKKAKVSIDPIHYTIAPKDDMPLSLFLQYLRSMANMARQD